MTRSVTALTTAPHRKPSGNVVAATTGILAHSGRT